MPPCLDEKGMETSGCHGGVVKCYETPNLGEVDAALFDEIEGYRRVLMYVLRMATLPGFALGAHTLSAMHFMLLEHDLSKSPGEFRWAAIYVQDESTGANVWGLRASAAQVSVRRRRLMIARTG